MKNLFITIIFSAALVLVPAVSFAQQPTPTPTPNPTTNWDGSIQIINNTGERDLAGIATKLINWLLMIIALVATIMIIYAGVLLVFNAGNEKRVSEAKRTLIWAIIGLVVALGAFAIVNIVQGVLS